MLQYLSTIKKTLKNVFKVGLTLIYVIHAVLEL